MLRVKGETLVWFVERGLRGTEERKPENWI